MSGQTVNVELPVRLSRMPTSAPVWVWIGYFAIIMTFCLFDRSILPLFAAAFSFQFWTFASHRGLMLTAPVPVAAPDEEKPRG